MMKLIEEIFNTILALVFTFSAIAGGGALLRKVHDEIKKEALTKISQGLPSLEAYTQKLTGKKLDF